MMKELIKISRYAGERFDLIQAGGGNSSVKNGDEMIIKSSGCHLLDIAKDSGFSVVDNKKVLKILEFSFGEEKKENDRIAADLVQKAIINGPRPSIETLLHSMFDKYTLHTHPLSVNIVCASKNCEEKLSRIFEHENEKILFVRYKTPGIELALELKTQMDIFQNIYNKKAKVVLLQNHGLIVSSDSGEDVQRITDAIVDKIDDFMGLDFKRYKLTNKISALLGGNNISYLSEDICLNSLLKTQPELFHITPFCPDKMVYCCADAVKISTLIDNDPILKFKKNYNDIPKVIIYEDMIFLTGSTIKKCKEVEEVLKFHILALSNIEKQNYNLLSSIELAYIGNWEAEKYRQNL